MFKIEGTPTDGMYYVQCHSRHVHVSPRLRLVGCLRGLQRSCTGLVRRLTTLDLRIQRLIHLLPYELSTKVFLSRSRLASLGSNQRPLGDEEPGVSNANTTGVLPVKRKSLQKGAKANRQKIVQKVHDRIKDNDVV